MRNYSKGFEPDGKAPEVFEMQIRSAPRSDVENNSQNKNWRIKEQVVVEIIDFCIVSQAVRLLHLNEVDEESSGTEEHYFKDHIVVGNEVKEEIHVSSTKNNKVNFLSSIRKFFLIHLERTSF